MSTFAVLCLLQTPAHLSYNFRSQASCPQSSDLKNCISKRHFHPAINSSTANPPTQHNGGPKPTANGLNGQTHRPLRCIRPLRYLTSKPQFHMKGHPANRLSMPSLRRLLQPHRHPSLPYGPRRHHGQAMVAHLPHRQRQRAAHRHHPLEHVWAFGVSS